MRMRYTRRQKKRHHSEMEAFSSTSNISAKSLSNLTTKGSFGILRTSWFRNCPCLLDLIKIWPRYWRLKRRLPFRNHIVFFVVGCTIILLSLGLIPRDWLCHDSAVNFINVRRFLAVLTDWPIPYCIFPGFNAFYRSKLKVKWCDMLCRR